MYASWMVYEKCSVDVIRDLGFDSSYWCCVRILEVFQVRVRFCLEKIEERLQPSSIVHNKKISLLLVFLHNYFVLHMLWNVHKRSFLIL